METVALSNFEIMTTTEIAGLAGVGDTTRYGTRSIAPKHLATAKTQNIT